MAGESRSKKVMGIAIATVAVAMAIYHMVSVHVLLVDTIQHQNIHIGFALTLVFLFALEGSRKRWQKILWPAMIVLLLVSIVYVHLFFVELQQRLGSPIGIDVVIGIILILVVLVATQLSYGPIFTVIALIFIGYGFIGHLLPEPWHTFKFDPAELVFWVTTSLEQGLYGTFLSISANFLFMFVLFGGLMQVSGATRFFGEVGKLLGKRFRGGAGISSVTTSALMGTVTGSVAANIVTTGAFTIPLMKKVGYEPYQAAAIESTASTGGMIMPPIMGAAAFLMSGWIGIPYIKIIAMATIPAILYFFCAGLYVQFQAMRMKIAPIREPINYREMLLAAPIFIIPLLIIIVLLTQFFSLMYVVFWATVALILLGLIRKKTRPSFKQWIAGVTSGAKLGAEIAANVALLGLAVGVITLTGLAIKLPAMVEAWSGGSLAIALIITALISIFLGMGLPTTAVYVVTALAAAPALVRMGLSIEQAHLFVFYFGVVGCLTPPVAVSAIVASKVAGSTYIKTAIESTKVGLAGFLVPFFMILVPIVVLQPQPPLLAAIGLLAIVIILISFQIGICRQYLVTLNQLERWLPIAIGIILLLSLALENYLLLAIGLGIFIVITLWQLRKRRGLSHESAFEGSP
jgi:TRAP transporter 4TM/12TM fusion protein